MSQEALEQYPEEKEYSVSDQEAGSFTSKARKRTTIYSDSENDFDKEMNIDDMTSSSKAEVLIDNGSKTKNITRKSRIKLIDTSDGDNSSTEDKNVQKKSIRTENKSKKLRDKFKNLISHQIKNSREMEIDSSMKLLNTDCEVNKNSYEEVSCLKIKQKIKKTAHSVNSICDPDTSDEENNAKVVLKMNSKRPKSRSTKPTSPKPLRMSAKQAMENMHKIKSESSRMLREKEISLPYHRPKALSLKDIMSKRKPAVTSDGKALPLKMNCEQLKQYVLLLEQRQKEVIELCKSDTEEDDGSDSVDEEALNKYTTTTATGVVIEPSLEDPDINKSIEEKNKPLEEINANEVLEDNTLNQSFEATNTNEINIIANESICIKKDAQKYTKTNCEQLTESPIETNTATDDVNIDLDKEYDKIGVNNRQLKINATEEISENSIVNVSEQNTDRDSQNMELHYDTEKVELHEKPRHSSSKDNNLEVLTTAEQEQNNDVQESEDDEFLDNDFNYDEIDKLIENAQIACDKVTNSTFANPKLIGSPGMVIDLDNPDPFVSKQLSGVDLLKERFTYFAELKSLEDMEKERDKKFKPGLQHLKLKQELEEQIAEQRSLEWEKRLEEEKRFKSEINGNFSDDDIEKLDAKIENADNNKCDKQKDEDESSEGEEELIENDILIEDKPKKRNPMVDDEAEESEDNDNLDIDIKDEADDGDEADLEESVDDDDSDSSSESENETESTKPRTGRILKAFEDSDDEFAGEESANQNQDENNKIKENNDMEGASKELVNDEAVKFTQEDDLQLAQRNLSSEDLFTTQESDKPNTIVTVLNKNNADHVSTDFQSQTFSIYKSVPNYTEDMNSSENTPICKTQTIGDVNITNLNSLIGVDKYPNNHVGRKQFSHSQEIGEDVIALCTGNFFGNSFISQDNPENPYLPGDLSEGCQSQEFGDDITALCTGKFYDNPMLSQYVESESGALKPIENPEKGDVIFNEEDLINLNKHKDGEESESIEKTILTSILEELDGPDFEKPKNKYFPSEDHVKNKTVDTSQVRKKFVIESDDESKDGSSHKKNKKFKKRKLEERALQISDDEEVEEEESAVDESDAESEINEDEERIVEYDSEENEVEVKQKTSKKKHIGAFFENEAELTSEDEWVGSGDEDERGLDRMEREEGDDETFHQGQLQKELGQIHLREVLDQDKREVRIIQELLFEDGDLGEGHRQRKFRWRNADGEEEMGTNPDEFLETQEEEFESEEQWRKQRHERETFLRTLQEKDEGIFGINMNRTAIIKENVCAGSNTEKGGAAVPEKKITIDIPNPKKSFTIFQQNYQGSLLTRGKSALARLAALATPLATADDDAPKAVTTANRRNFVFAALSQDEQSKVTKRKADTNITTPRLIKKLKTDDQNKHYKSSLFDLLKS